MNAIESLLLRDDIKCKDIEVQGDKVRVTLADALPFPENQVRCRGLVAELMPLLEEAFARWDRMNGSDKP